MRLFPLTHESAGSNCANGGTRIDVGVDDNSNGVFEASEIDQTQYVCDGGSSNNTMLTSISSPPSNMGCDAGGRVISHGLDNGDGGGTYANGVLETGEIDSTTTFCSRFISDDYNLKSWSRISIAEVVSNGRSSTKKRVWQHSLFLSQRRNQRSRIVEERWNGLRHGDGQGYLSGSSSSSLDELTAVGNTLYFGAERRNQRKELWKSDGTSSGTVMVKDINSGSSRHLSIRTHSRWQHPLFPEPQRRNERNRIVEERWNSLRHCDGQGYHIAEVAAVEESALLPSQPLATPSISEPTTEPTEKNCGRAMELPQAR